VATKCGHLFLRWRQNAHACLTVAESTTVGTAAARRERGPFAKFDFFLTQRHRFFFRRHSGHDTARAGPERTLPQEAPSLPAETGPGRALRSATLLFFPGHILTSADCCANTALAEHFPCRQRFLRLRHKRHAGCFADAARGSRSRLRATRDAHPAVLGAGSGAPQMHRFFFRRHSEHEPLPALPPPWASASTAEAATTPDTNLWRACIGAGTTSKVGRGGARARDRR
jgi:hypothetical protein